jgi:hypothetical protein
MGYMECVSAAAKNAAGGRCCSSPHSVAFAVVGYPTAAPPPVRLTSARRPLSLSLFPTREATIASGGPFCVAVLDLAPSRERRHQTQAPTRELYLFW